MILAPAKPLISIAVALALAAAMAAPAAAQSCGAEVERLAGQYNLSPETPPGGSSGLSEPAHPPPAVAGVGMAQERAQSSGVATPSDVGSVAAIQPPRSGPGRPAGMPPPPTLGAGAGAGGLGADDRARMASLLQAARAALRQGKDGECLERLREAAAVPHAPAAN